MFTKMAVAAAVASAVTLSSPAFGQDKSPASNGLAELNRGNYANAVELLCAAVRNAPADLEVRRNLCRAFIEAGMEREAIRQLSALIKFGCSSPRDYSMMAQAYYQLGNSKTAICYYKEALQIDASNTEARIGIARTLISSGDLRGATSACVEGLRLATSPQARQQLNALLGTIRTKTSIVRIAANS